MYLRRASLRNIRSILTLDWTVDEGKEAGWHVILGDNGAGKSTFLRGIAIALLGPHEWEGLRLDWSEWVSHERESASVEIVVSWDGADNFAVTDREPMKRELVARCRIDGDNGRSAAAGEPSSPRSFIMQGLWGSRPGWFSASYGPFRRFSGGDSEFAGISQSRPRLAAHLSLFGENYALTEALRWLQELDHRRKDQRPEGRLLERLTTFVNNSKLLPHDSLLKRVDSDGVTFEDGNGCEVSVLELSDGYRSILSLTFELIRQMSIVYGADAVFESDSPTAIDLPGVVLIDEIDVHLHPTWQQSIGNWFTTCFPNIQFIVTTHSPIVCQAAINGSVWRLPRPGTDEQAQRLVGTELNRLIYGDVLDAYGTGVFGEGVARSAAGRERLRDLAALNAKSLSKPLSAAERKRRDELRNTTPTAGSVLPSLEVPLALLEGDEQLYWSAVQAIISKNSEPDAQHVEWIWEQLRLLVSAHDETTTPTALSVRPKAEVQAG